MTSAGDRRLVAEWDDNLATYRYVSQKFKLVVRDGWRDTAWVTVASSADPQWARATATHYNLELPDPINAVQADNQPDQDSEPQS